MTTSSPLPTDEDREALVDIEITHRPTSWNGGSGCTCGATNPGMTMHLQQWHRVHLVDAILAAGFRRSVVSTPSEEVRAMIEEALVTLKSPHPGSTVREGSRVGTYDFQRANEETRRILRDALEASAVSAPPTITDEAVTGVYVAGPQGAALRAALGGAR